MARPKNNLKQHLSKFKEAIPNRARLAYESMFAATEQERAAAQVLLDLLPRETRTTDEQIQWQTDIWLNAPSVKELALSPAGRQILEMVGDSKPVGDYVTNRYSTDVKSPEPSVPPAPSVEQPIPPLAPPPGPSDDLGERMEQERAAKREREKTNPPWKWDMLKPSTPDKSLRPLAPSDWNADANNSPIY